MSDGRTVWWAKDSAWWRRERVVELGEEFGSAGPAVVDWLACEAKAQNAGGRVQAGHRTVARGCFVEVVTVGHVLSRAVTLGLLDDFAEDAGRFECRISGWGAEQDRVKATARKAEQRIRESVGKGDPPRGSRSVTPGHAESRPVTESPPTGQDRTDTSSLRSEATRKRATRRVDQSQLPEDFPDDLAGRVDPVLAILHRCWDTRGGIEPGRRGVGLALMRNPRADHEQTARKLEHWLLAGKGQRARCADVASRFGDWVEGEGAAQSGQVVPLHRENASDWLRDDFEDGEPIPDADVVSGEAS